MEEWPKNSIPIGAGGPLRFNYGSGLGSGDQNLVGKTGESCYVLPVGENVSRDENVCLD